MQYHFSVSNVQVAIPPLHPRIVQSSLAFSLSLWFSRFSFALCPSLSGGSWWSFVPGCYCCTFFLYIFYVSSPFSRYIFVVPGNILNYIQLFYNFHVPDRMSDVMSRLCFFFCLIPSLFFFLFLVLFTYSLAL